MTVLGSVIDRVQNVMISHGALDMVLIANGTLLAIQNMTWGGKQGFQSPPSEPFYVPYHDEAGPATLAASGIMGTTHTERGLTYVGVDLSGHMVPQYQPSAAFRQLEVLLGRVRDPSVPTAFTTNTSSIPALINDTTSSAGSDGGNSSASGASNAAAGLSVPSAGVLALSVAASLALLTLSV